MIQCCFQGLVPCYFPGQQVPYWFRGLQALHFYPGLRARQRNVQPARSDSARPFPPSAAYVQRGSNIGIHCLVSRISAHSALKTMYLRSKEEQVATAHYARVGYFFPDQSHVQGVPNTVQSRHRWSVMYVSRYDRPSTDVSSAMITTVRNAIRISFGGCVLTATLT